MKTVNYCLTIMEKDISELSEHISFTIGIAVVIDLNYYVGGLK